MTGLDNNAVQVLIVDDEAVRVKPITWYAKEWLGEKTIVVTHLTHMPDTFAGYTMVFLDHDLGNAGDVYDILKNKSPDEWMVRPFTTFVVHSMNPIGRLNIARYLREQLRVWYVVEEPFSNILTRFTPS